MDGLQRSASSDHHHTRGWLVTYGAVLLLLGLLALIFPVTATLTTTITIGFFVMIAGVAAIAGAFVGGRHQHRPYALLMGILSLVVGALLAFQPAAGALSLTILATSWLGIRGIMEIILGLRLHTGRWTMIALGAFNLLLAALLLSSLPISALTLPGYVFGFSFLASGVQAIVSGFRNAPLGEEQSVI